MIYGNIEDYQLNRTLLLFLQQIRRNSICLDSSHPDFALRIAQSGRRRASYFICLTKIAKKLHYIKMFLYLKKINFTN